MSETLIEVKNLQVHFKRKSAPTLKISHSLLPHGWGFFNFTISPTS